MNKIDFARRACLPAILMMTISLAQAGQVTTLAQLGADDSVDWGQFGPSGTAVNGPSAPYAFLAQKALGGSITIHPLGVLETANPATWQLPGTALALDNQFTGPIGMVFGTNLVQGIGFYISSAFGGAFTATLSIFDPVGNNLGTYQQPGGPANPVVFIGALDATPDIGGILVSMTNGSGNNYFTLDTLEFVDRVSAPPAPAGGVPEPATFALAGSALAGLAQLRKLRRKS